MAQYVTIASVNIPYDKYEMGRDIYMNANRNTLRVICPKTEDVVAISALLDERDNLSTIVFTNEDAIDEEGNPYTATATFSGYLLKMACGKESILITNSDPQEVDTEHYEEKVVFKIAQITKQEKKLIDRGIDPWEEDEEDEEY